MFGVLKKIYRLFLRMLPIKPAVYLIYFRGYKKKLDLKNPRYFGEKIQWLKLYGNLEVLSRYVDKYEVREYVKKICGEEYLIPLLGVYDSVDEINFDELPNKFVLKSTNGCGTVLVCENKRQFERNKAIYSMKKWLKDDYSREKKEMQYKYVKNRIIAEKYMEDTSGDLTDYKFYCFDGKVRYYAIASERKNELKYDYFDVNGKKLEKVRAANIKNGGKITLTKVKLSEMIEIAEKLAKLFQFVRVDLYLVDEKIKFGELTFTDGAGSDPFHPITFDLEIAEGIKLVRYENIIKNHSVKYEYLQREEEE